MPEENLESCPGCGLVLSPLAGGETHPYLGASAACWALYTQVLEREYSNAAYMRVHRVTVDAYAVQHPGTPERRTVQSLNVHLVGLYLTLERGSQPDFVRRVAGALTRQAEALHWMEPPIPPCTLTVADVLEASTAEAHAQRVMDWGRAVWSAWRAHHHDVARLADRVSGAFA